MLHDHGHEIEESVSLQVHGVLEAREGGVEIKVISGCRKHVRRLRHADDALEDARHVGRDVVEPGDHETAGRG